MILLAFISFWLGLLFKKNIFFYLVLIILLLLFILKKYKKKKFVFSLITVCLGIGISYIKFDRPKQVFKGMVYDIKENYFLFNSGFERFYVYEKNHSYEVGDILSISANKLELNFTRIESSFDFKEYLNDRGVFYQLYVEEINFKLKTPFRLNKYRSKIGSYFDQNTREFINSTLFHKNESELIDEMRQLNLTRLISVSGFYIFSFYTLFSSLLCRILKEKTANIVSLSILSVYVLLTFPRFSNIKAWSMILLQYLNKNKWNNKLNKIDVLGGSGIIFLLLNKYLAYQDSFLLTYFIPIISFFSGALYTSFKGFKKKIVRYVVSFLLYAPFTINYFGCFNLVSYIFQLLLFPLYEVVLSLGLLCYLGLPIQYLVNILTKPLLKIDKLYWLKYLNINIPPLNNWGFLIYYVLLISLIYLFSINLKPLIKPLKATFISLISLYILPLNNSLINFVSFINVGQGDSCLIHYKNKNLLIDTGGITYGDIAVDSLIPYFRKLRIYKIDYLITTHNDFDHNGGVESLKSHFIIKNYLTSFNDFPLSVKGLQICNYNLNININNDDNENSLVLGFTVNNTSFLITGDAPIEVEKEIIKNFTYIPCDVLKIGHHGSKTSTSSFFIEYLNPKEAVISVGKNNYGHPNKEVLNILKNHDVIIKRTDVLGTIMYKFSILSS